MIPGLYTGPTWTGLRIGLLGGSFNPAHAGHRHVSLMALRLLDLDQIWWLVSPQNPLKSSRGMAKFEQRLRDAAAIAHHPRILVSDLERRLGTRFTVDTLAALRLRYPKTRFVWLMGADNLGQIQRWRRWRRIFETVPVAVFDRPPSGLRMLASQAAARYRRDRIAPTPARGLARKKPPAWTFFASRLEPLSSTQIRLARQNRPVAKPRRRPHLQGDRVRARGVLIATEAKPPAGRKRARKPASAPAPSSATLRDAIARSLDDDKAEDIVVIDLERKSDIADFLVIATGRSSRQVASMADHIVERLQPDLSFRIAVEGQSQGDWVLVDCGDVVVHLFRPEVRSFYAIEKMWGHEPPRAQGAPDGRAAEDRATV